LAGVGAYLVTLTFGRGGIPLFIGGDPGFFWVHAHRVLRGELPYRDFFQFTAPGTDLVYAVAFRVLGERMWVANAVAIAVGVGLAASCLAMARHLLNLRLAALASMGYVVLFYAPGLHVSPHHWLSAIAIMTATSVFASNRSALHHAAAGALLGLACFFTQTHGVAAFVAFLAFELGLAWAGRPSAGEQKHRVGALAAGFVGALVVEYGLLVAMVGVKPTWACMVAYVVNQVPRTHWVGFGLPEHVTATSVTWLWPYLVAYATCAIGYLVGPIVILRRVRSKRSFEPGDRAAVLVWIVGVALLAEVSVALSWGRLFGVAMPGALLFVWLLRGEGPLLRAVELGAWVGVAYLSVFFVQLMHDRYPVACPTEAGTVAADPESMEKLSWLRANAAGGSFFAADWPSAYLPLNRDDRLRLIAVAPGGATSHEQVQATVRELEALSVDHVLWPPRLVDDATPAQGITDIRDYLHGHYHLVHTFNDGDEVWSRSAVP
jgi:hypothetical protein